MFQTLCLLLVVVVTQALAASTAGRTFCSGDLLKGFVEKGEEGCCIAEGLCHDPVKTKKLAEHLNQINKPSIRKKRSLDVGSHLRDHLLSRAKNIEHQEEEESQTLMAPLEFDDTTTDSIQTCPTGCTADTLEICPSDVKLAFPLFGTSVTKKKKVHIIQAGQRFDQPVVRRVCKHSRSLILQGSCKQIYQPQLMFIAPDNSGVATMDLDYVYVESGCEAAINIHGGNDSSDSSSSSSEMESLEGSSLADHGLEGVEGGKSEVKSKEDEKTEDESPVHTEPPPEPTPEPEHHDDEIISHPEPAVVPAEVPAHTTMPPPAAEPEVDAAEDVEATTVHHDTHHDMSHDHFEDPDHHDDHFDHPEHHELDLHPEETDVEGAEELASATTTRSP